MQQAAKDFLKQKKTIFFIPVLLISIVIVFKYNESKHSSSSTTGPNMPPASPTREAFATGLSYVEYKENKKIVSFKLDEFEITKQKIGYFRIGFFKIAKMKGVEFNFFLDTPEKESVQMALSNTEFDLQKHFTDSDIIKMLKIDKIKGLEIKNIVINIFQGDTLFSSLKSNYARLDYNEKHLIFSGDVVLNVANGKSLRCNTLKWLTHNSRLSTNGTYEFKQNGSVRRGRVIECDFFLNNIRFAELPQKLNHSGGGRKQKKID